MSPREQQDSSSPSSGDGLDVSSPSTLNGTTPSPTFDPGVVDFPLRITRNRATLDPPRPWPTVLPTRFGQIENTAENYRPYANGLSDAAASPGSEKHTSPRQPRVDNVERSVDHRSPYTRLNEAFPRSSLGLQPRLEIPSQQLGHLEGGFTPMAQHSTFYMRGILSPSLWTRQLQITGISANYGGNIFLQSNQSANISEELSTSLWLTNLPPDCTHQLLLGAIRGCGKIYAAVINPPVISNNYYSPGSQHSTAASKLVFFDRAGLDRLMAKSLAGEFSVGGYVPRLRMNRIKSAPRPAGPHCRVLHIEGPSTIVNERFLGDFFQSKFKYELEIVLTLGQHGARTRQEWRFGSYRCQAESARQAINREKLRLNMSEADRRAWSQVSVHFGVDPCA
ncbi:hypothetical protein F4805DRAFT_476337 [Annulohypoxylon moriforme]|nr:hypothetical protein F4805DRAFT_476337 [Annulohypoxylon moriforme]